MALAIAQAAERLDETGKREALHLVQNLEALHPFGKAWCLYENGRMKPVKP
jgi:hypothetical protein